MAPADASRTCDPLWHIAGLRPHLLCVLPDEEGPSARHSGGGEWHPGSLLIDSHPSRSHLAQNPFVCDCHLKWLADYLQDNPIETSGARCSSPRRLANKRISQIKSKKFRCSGNQVTGLGPTFRLSTAAPERPVIQSGGQRAL